MTPEKIIKKLKNGEVIKTPSGATIKMIDGVIVRCFKDGRYTINASVGNSEVDREGGETFEITKAGKYRTRDGRIAYVSSVNNDTADGIIKGEKTVTTWYVSGRYSESDDPDDLVEYIGD